MIPSSLSENLNEIKRLIKDKKYITVVGGGGKTSLIFMLTKYLTGIGKKVIVTTTTHMAMEYCRPMVLSEDYRRLSNYIMEYGYAMVGEITEDGKLTSPAKEMWNHMERLADVILVEGDGAKRLPLKIPAAHEPIIPYESDMVIGVVGLDALDKPICETCHREDITAKFLGKKSSDVVTESDIAKIIVSHRGLQKGVRHREFVVVLNKGNTDKLRHRGCLIGEMVRDKLEVPVIITSLNRQQISVILLAAGNSNRFGEDNKLLQPIEGKPMFAHILEKALALECGSVTVVTQYEEIEEMSRERGAKVIYNPYSEEGISSSIKLGVKANSNASGWLICMGDQPYLTVDTLEELIHHFLGGGENICAVSYGRKIGTPSIFSQKYKRELLNLVGDTGGKHIISENRHDTWVYECQKEELADIDRKKDYKNVKKM